MFSRGTDAACHDTPLHACARGRHAARREADVGENTLAAVLLKCTLGKDSYSRAAACVLLVIRESYQERKKHRVRTATKNIFAKMVRSKTTNVKMRTLITDR